MRRTIPLLAILLLLPVDQADGQLPPCPPPRHSLETLKEALLVNAHRSERSVVALLSFGVFDVGGCSVLPEDADLEEVMDSLIRFAAQEEVPALQRGILRGIIGATGPTTGGALPVPLDALAFAIEEGRTEFVRSHALRTAGRLAEDEDVRAYLLRWARAERGPPLFPDLPERIADRTYYVVSIARPDLFRAALESDPSQVRNAKVRCLVEIPAARAGNARRCPD